MNPEDINPPGGPVPSDVYTAAWWQRLYDWQDYTHALAALGPDDDPDLLPVPVPPWLEPDGSRPQLRR